MRQLLPVAVDDVDPVAVYANMPAAEGRPGLRVNMVSSMDGAITIDGVSGPLSGPPDREVYRVLRSLTDVVLVAAGTVRAENYTPARVVEEYVAARRARHQTDAPRIAVCTRHLDLDFDAPLFREATERTIIVTTEDAPAEPLAVARTLCDVIAVGTGRVDLREALVVLGEMGARHVLCEGGPTLNGSLAQAGLIDELCLTTSPRLAGGRAGRILAGADLPSPTAFELRTLLEDDGFLFARYREIST